MAMPGFLGRNVRVWTGVWGSTEAAWPPHLNAECELLPWALLVCSLWVQVTTQKPQTREPHQSCKPYMTTLSLAWNDTTSECSRLVHNHFLQEMRPLSRLGTVCGWAVPQASFPSCAVQNQLNCQITETWPLSWSELSPFQRQEGKRAVSKENTPVSQ